MFRRPRIELWSAATQGSGAPANPSPSVTDSVGLSDTVAAQVTPYLVTVSNGVNVTDSVVVRLNPYEVVATDALGLSDAVIATLSGATGATIIDSLGLSDSVFAEVTPLEIVVTDAAGITDTVTIEVSPLEVSVAEAIAIAESVAAGTNLFPAVAEDAVGLTDGVTIEITPLEASVADGISLADTVVAAIAGAGAGNNFASATNCVAVWNLDSGALTTDSKGTNTLTNNSVTAAESWQQGDGAGLFVGATPTDLRIADASLDAGFPFSSTDTGLKATFTFWCNFNSFPAADGGSAWMLSKNQAYSGSTFSVEGYTSGGQHYIRGWISENGTGQRILSSSAGIQTGRWYHVGYTYDASTGYATLRIYDATADSVICNEAGTVCEATGIYLNNFPFVLGNGILSYADKPFDGVLDEVCVFNDVLSSSDIDLIRNQTYGPALELDALIADALSVGDSVTVHLSPLLVDVAETINVADVVESRFPVLYVTVSDGVGTADTIWTARNVADRHVVTRVVVAANNQIWYSD